jgi:hypothetical protein
MNRGLGTVVALLAAVLMAGCAGGEGDESGGGEAGGESAADAESTADNAAEEGAGGDSDSGETAAQPAILLDPASREIIYTVDLTVEVDNVVDSVRRAAEMATTAGGFVATETTEGDESASLTLRVPTENHADVVSRLEDLGDVRNRFRTAEDVTEQVVDVEARIASPAP